MLGCKGFGGTAGPASVCIYAFASHEMQFTSLLNNMNKMPGNYNISIYLSDKTKVNLIKILI